MTPKQHELLDRYSELILDHPLKFYPPVMVSGRDTMSYLWPINDVLRPQIHRIQSMRYRKQYERDANKAIERFVFEDEKLENNTLPVLRVIAERHMQSLMLCVANQLANNLVMPVPLGFPEQALTKYTILFLWYDMKLFYPITEKSAFDIDSPFEAVSGKLH